VQPAVLYICVRLVGEGVFMPRGWGERCQMQETRALSCHGRRREDAGGREEEEEERGLIKDRGAGQIGRVRGCNESGVRGYFEYD